MEAAFVEFALFAVAVVLVYRILRPVQAHLESLILRLLDPKERRITDAEIVPENNRKKRKE
ncbi:MAG: hypothetical protein HY077_01175 [Elusimicrobia bacterium]|nr:hypothetical protein [Elusimicrobiota bacterium]